MMPDPAKIKLAFGGANYVCADLLWRIIFILFCSYTIFAISACSNSKIKKQENHDIISPESQIIYLYQEPLDHLSAVRPGICPMYPHCSKYALQAIDKHGAFIGWMMTFDRLIRCGRDEISLSPEIIANGKKKTFDTIEQNDFWWADPNTNTTFKNIPSLDQSQAWEVSIE